MYGVCFGSYRLRRISVRQPMESFPADKAISIVYPMDLRWPWLCSFLIVDKEASLSLAVGPIPSAAAVLLYMVVLQSLICFLWIVLKEPEQLNLIKITLMHVCLLDSLVWRDRLVGLLL